MPDDSALRAHLVELLRGGHAHATFEDAARGMSLDRAGIRPHNTPHSAWEQLEHLRIAQNDILRFSQSAEWKSPAWPAGYWPESAAPESFSQWQQSVDAFEADRDEFIGMIQDAARDLYRPFPWGDGQTLLREALLIADHNAYHIGQLVLVRRLVGAWKK